MQGVEKGELVSKKAKRVVSFVVKDRKTGKKLYEWETTFTDDHGRGFDGPIFAMAVVDHADKQLKELVKVDVKMLRKPKK